LGQPDTAERERQILARWRGQAAAEQSLSPSLQADLSQLFAEHTSRVYAVCYRYVGQPERAAELAQDTLLTAWRDLARFRGESTLWTWLYGIARHHCLNAIRRRKDLLTDDGVIEAGSEEASVLAKLRRSEREELLRQAAAASLDEQEQEAIYLRYVERLPQDEITRLLELDSSSGARGLLQRCRRKLARELRRRLAAVGHGTSFIRDSR